MIRLNNGCYQFHKSDTLDRNSFFANCFNASKESIGYYTTLYRYLVCQIATVSPSLSESMPPALKNIIKNCHQADSEARLTTIQELQTQLQSLQQKQLALPWNLTY